MSPLKPIGFNSFFIPPVVTGGTLTSDATYYYRTFTSNGTLGVSGGVLSCDVMVVSGGGGGGSNRYSGGGGAGGLKLHTALSLSTNENVGIGGGGAGGSGGGANPGSAGQVLIWEVTQVVVEVTAALLVVQVVTAVRAVVDIHLALEFLVKATAVVLA